MLNYEQRQINQLKRIKQRSTQKEKKAIDRIIADMSKLDLPINKKYRFVKDMYGLGQP